MSFRPLWVMRQRRVRGILAISVWTQAVSGSWLVQPCRQCSTAIRMGGTQRIEDTPMANISTLPPHLQQRLEAELKPGESLAWAGQPNPNRYMRTGFKEWLFFIPWTAFALFWMARASDVWVSGSGIEWKEFPFLGLPFLLIGLGGLAYPLWMRRRAISMIYAISNQRAIAIEGEKPITVVSYRALDITSIERTEHQDGSGNVVLWTEHYRDSDGYRQTRQHGFFAIDDVRHVARLAERLTRPNIG